MLLMGVLLDNGVEVAPLSRQPQRRRLPREHVLLRASALRLPSREVLYVILRETGVLLPNQRQHRTLHIQKHVLPSQCTSYLRTQHAHPLVSRLRTARNELLDLPRQNTGLRQTPPAITPSSRGGFVLAYMAPGLTTRNPLSVALSANKRAISCHRGTWLTRPPPAVGPYGSPIPRDLW